MRKIKFLSVMVVFSIMTLLVSVNISSASSSITTIDPKETIIKACMKFQNIESYHMTLDFAASFSQGNNNMDAFAKSECDVQVKPMLAKNTMNMSMKVGNKKFEQDFAQYFEESENEILLYSNGNDQWMKQSLPKNGYNPLNQYEDYLKAIKCVTLKSEDANEIVFEVINDANYLKENLERNLASAGMLNTKLMVDLLKNVDDFKYIIFIDKKTSYISKIVMDLSDCISKIGSNVVELRDIPGNQKNTTKEMFKNMKLTTTMTFSKINNVEKFTIPEEVKSQANVTRLKESNAYPSIQMTIPKIIEQSPVVYPSVARVMALEGRVILKVNISDKGTVTDTEIIKSSGYEILDKAAVNSVIKWRFIPAQINGKAIASNIVVPIKFQIEDNSFILLDSAKIKNIQQKLNELGFECGEPDGIMGPNTEQAIKDFQQSKGLEPDGIVGFKTKEALGLINKTN